MHQDSSLLTLYRRWLVGAAALMVAMGLIPATQTAQAAGPVSCPGQLSAGSYKYRVSNLTVIHTTCAVGKRLSSEILPSREVKPRQVDGFHCDATVHYSNPNFPLGGGYQEYTCRQRRKTVRWQLEIPNES
jgi:hypothetical protein